MSRKKKFYQFNEHATYKGQEYPKDMIDSLKEWDVRDIEAALTTHIISEYPYVEEDLEDGESFSQEHSNSDIG